MNKKEKENNLFQCVIEGDARKKEILKKLVSNRCFWFGIWLQVDITHRFSKLRGKQVFY